MIIRLSYVLALLLFLGGSVIGLVSSWGQADAGAPRETAPQFVFPESIKGFDENKVKEDPICDPTTRPQITHVEPDEVKAGDTVVVRGKHFGKKECFRGVSFGSHSAKVFTFVDAEKIEATVPEGLRAGLTFLDVVTGGGTARKSILVKAKD